MSSSIALNAGAIENDSRITVVYLFINDFDVGVSFDKFVNVFSLVCYAVALVFPVACVG